MPKVSIILPNYNHAPYLERRVQSILNQTYQDFELIYLDDASTDNSNEIFAKYTDYPRVRTILNSTNSGSPFKQWNKGIRQASGEYIWIAESDDYSDSRQLATLVEKLDQNPSVGLAYCRSWRVGANDKPIGSCRDWILNPDRERWEKDFVNSGIDECSQYMSYENTILNASSLVMRRTIYEQAGFADETLRLCGDWMMWIKMLLISDIAYVAAPLNYYRQHFKTVRSQSDLNGLSIEENYRVISYILNHLDCSSEITEHTLKKFFGQWVRLFLSNKSSIPWNRNYSIYRLAQRIDPKLHYRIFREVIHVLLLRSHLLAPTRQVVQYVKQLTSY
jgi:glycosyltransferase involved in cell wall biosynthesis